MVIDRIYNYFERNPQLHVLFIFDRMNIIETDLSGVQWCEGYVFHIFNGSWFNTKYNIEYTWKDSNIVLLFRNDSLPQTEEDMLKFPLLDMLKANMEYKEDDYSAFIQQYGLSEKYLPFIKRNITELMSSKITGILNGYISSETFSEDLACRGFISSYLGEKKLLDWEMIFVKMIILGADFEDKKCMDFFNRVAKNLDAKKCLDERLARIFGFSYNVNAKNKMKEIAESLKYNSITQLFEAAANDNYKKYKVVDGVAINLINKIYDAGMSDRLLSEKFSKAYHILSSDIKESEIIDLYGIEAPYFHMTDGLCWPILDELVKNQLIVEPDKVNENVRELSLKMPQISKVQKVISFIEQLALYYDMTRTFDTLKLNTPEDYIQLYLEKFHKVDRIYREAIESYYEAIRIDSPIENTIVQAKKMLDQEYAKIVNVLNLEWLNCVKERKDYFDSISLKRQEDFFNNEYDPSVKQAVIISDALRYEVAVEIMEAMSKERHIATLSAYRAMLPTETKFCKLSLLPHNKLELAGADMTVDGASLATIADRTAHVAKFKGDAVCITFDEFMSYDTKMQREICKSRLVYIFHDAIDKASHSSSPMDVITACKKAVEELTMLISRLHATANVNNVILTADHGFLYNDMRFEEKDKHSIKEDCIDKKTRYYLTTSKDEVSGIIKFPLQAVSGIKSHEQVYVAVPEGSNRLAAPGGYNFAHGGATLQEMIIPVIHSKLRREEKSEKVGVALLNHNLNMVSSRVKIQIIQSEAVSMTVQERTIECCVYNGDEPVTEKKEVTLNSTDSININNRISEVTLTLNKTVSAPTLQLRIYDIEDPLNPLIRETVKNNTMIEQDF